MDQATNGTIPERKIDQPASISPPACSLTITALAEHHVQLFAVDDDARDAAWAARRDAVETLILGLEPQNLAETFALAHVVEIELDVLSSADHVSCSADRLRLLHQAQRAVRRGMGRYTGAKSPMVPEYLH